MKLSTFEQLFKVMGKKSPLFSTLWKKSQKEFGSNWEEEISENIKRIFGAEYNTKWDEAVKGYISFCTDALKAMNYFERFGKYKASSYEECLEMCYKSPEYMKLRYLPGQYLSHYIWPHHQRMLRRYLTEFLPSIKDNVSTFYEIGVGCGMYSQKTLEYMPQVKGIGYDISDYSLEFTDMVVKNHGLSDRYQVLNQNILETIPDTKADLVICQEVLEHIEDPQAFVDALYAVTKSGGYGYITAAVNAAHTDHIYLYTDPKEVEQQLLNSGWKIIKSQIEENYPEKPKKFRPVIAGYLTRKE